MTHAVVKDSVKVSLSTEKNKFSVKGDLVITVVVDNLGDREFRFCKYQTPFEGFLADFMWVENKNSGNKIAYTGPMVKRMKPTDKDFLIVEPGESKTCKINLSKAYKVKEAGEYAIQFKGGYIHGLPDSDTLEIVIGD